LPLTGPPGERRDDRVKNGRPSADGGQRIDRVLRVRHEADHVPFLAADAAMSRAAPLGAPPA